MTITKLFALAAAVQLAGAALAQLDKTAAPGATAPKKGEEVAVLDTNHGKIVIKFFAGKAPKHVASFKKLARKGFYNGTLFHRIIPGFMIQGGDPLTKSGDRSRYGTGGPGYTLPAEFNSTKHTPGIVSAARTSDPNSAGSQFFIVQGKPASHLDGQYTVFGQVVKGMNVVDKIASLPRDERDIPLESDKAIIKSVKIVKWPVR